MVAMGGAVVVREEVVDNESVAHPYLVSFEINETIQAAPWFFDDRAAHRHHDHRDPGLPADTDHSILPRSCQGGKMSWESPSNRNGCSIPPFFDVAESELEPLIYLSNYGVTAATLSCPADLSPKAPVYSYPFNAVPDSEDSAAIKRVGRSGRITVITKLSKLQLATDGSYQGIGGFPHPAKSFNVLWADGHVTVSNAMISTIH